MIRPTRIVMLVALIATAACKKAAGPAVDPALSTLVPADTVMLVGVRVEDLLKTPIYQKYLAKRPIPSVDEFAAEFGIDPRKDLWELLYISNGKESVMLGRGRFSNEAEPRIARETEGGVRSNYRGFTLVGDDNSAVLLMGPSLMGVGNTAMLKQVVDTRDKTNGPPEILQERMKELPSGVALWSVFSGSPIPKPDAKSVNANTAFKLFQMMQSGSFYVDLRMGVSAKVAGITGSDEDAKELESALRGFVGLARLSTSKNDVKMQKFFDGLRVTAEGHNVNVYLDEPEEAVGTVMDLFLGATQGRGTAIPTPGR